MGFDQIAIDVIKVWFAWIVTIIVAFSIGFVVGHWIV